MVELLTAALTVLTAAIPLAPPSLKSLRTWPAKRLARTKVTAVTPDKRSRAFAAARAPSVT